MAESQAAADCWAESRATPLKQRSEEWLRTCALHPFVQHFAKQVHYDGAKGRAGRVPSGPKFPGCRARSVKSAV